MHHVHWEKVLGSAAARDMENPDPRIIRQLLLVNFSTVAMVTLTEKKSQVERSTLANLWETSRVSVLRKNKRELRLERLAR